MARGDLDEELVPGGCRCELCGRLVTRITRHHLIPRMSHRQRRVRKRFSSEERQQRVAWLCRPCHSNVHQHIGEKELADRYAELALLAAHPAVVRFSRWMADKPDGFRPVFRGGRRRG